jgi:predicted metal-dependent hydrolase
VSKKSAKIAALIDSCQGKALEAHYLGYFQCFNEGLFYEAHDVLEELWLTDTKGPSGNFYKALIQFAGAFVHMQKDCPRHPRLRPAAALLNLARGYLQPYQPTHRHLDVSRIIALADEWLRELEDGQFEANPLKKRRPPRLLLSPTSEGTKGK